MGILPFLGPCVPNQVGALQQEPVLQTNSNVQYSKNGISNFKAFAKGINKKSYYFGMQFDKGIFHVYILLEKWFHLNCFLHSHTLIQSTSFEVIRVLS